jgi:RNA polymerase-binding transcription factor DksA
MAALRTTRETSPDDDEHDPEGPTLSSEWSRIRGLLLAAELRLGETDAALARVDDGSYGVCLVCHRPIAAARLEARPTASLCVECASRL